MRQILSRLKERNQNMQRRTVWIFFSQLCEALKHMHVKRIMHRDIKPANMFVDIEHGLLKVGDLGLSRAMHEYSLKAFSQVGTPLYMSPEVLKGEGHDFASDIWSLGCVLYELASLHSPFEGSNGNLPKPDIARGGQTALFQLFQNIIKCDFPPLDEKYGTDLSDSVHAMLQLNPRHRPSIAKIAHIAMQARCSYGDESSSSSTSSSLKNSARLDGFVSNPSTAQLNGWYLEQHLKSGAGAKDGGSDGTLQTGGEDVMQNDGFTSFVGLEEDQTEEAKGLLEASTHAAQCLRESLNGAMIRDARLGVTGEGSLAVSEVLPVNHATVESSRPATAGTDVELSEGGGGSVVDESCRLSRASSFDVEEDSHLYDMGETSNMTVEDSQDDIVCIDPSVIRQLRIQHGLETSKEEYPREDGPDDEDEAAPWRGENRDDDNDHPFDNEDDDGVLSESEQLVEDVAGMRLEIDLDEHDAVESHVVRHWDSNRSPDNFHALNLSISMTYSPCDSVHSSTPKGNQKDESHRQENAHFHLTFPPPQYNKPPLCGAQGTSLCATSPSTAESSAGNTTEMATAMQGDVASAELLGSKEGTVLSLVGGARVSRSEPNSGSRSFRMMDEPIGKEFQSEELVGTMSVDMLTTNHKHSTARFETTATREDLASNSLCVFSERQRHEHSLAQFNRTRDTGSSIPTSSKIIAPAHSDAEELAWRNVEARMSIESTTVTGPHIDSLGPASTSTSSSVSNEADGNPSTQKSEVQSPLVKKDRSGQSLDPLRHEFSDAVVNISAELSHGLNQLPHSNVDSVTSYIPPPIRVPRVATSDMQYQKPKRSGEKRLHNEVSESSPNQRSNSTRCSKHEFRFFFYVYVGCKPNIFVQYVSAK